ncbi:MAG: palindromic element RPE5 domain-containing protein [Rickettsia endosymbiont of Pentastiridius leporinus]
MKSRYTKINLEKRHRSVDQGTERTEVCEHSRSYKDIVANFSSSILAVYRRYFKIWKSNKR